MNLFQILDTVQNNCTSLHDVISIVKFVLGLIQWVIPIVLIILITIDMFKAMTSGDEKAVKGAQKQAVTRLAYAVVIFLVPLLVNLVFNLVGSMNLNSANTNQATSFFTCWNEWKENVEDIEDGKDGKDGE